MDDVPSKLPGLFAIEQSTSSLTDTLSSISGPQCKSIIILLISAPAEGPSETFLAIAKSWLIL